MKANKDTRKRLNGSTELKRLEEERERLINQFLAEPCHILTMMRWMPIGMIVADSSSRLILSNQRAQQIWRHDFVPANSIEEYQAYHGFHPDGAPYKPEEWPLARSIMTGEVVTDEEINFERGDGSRGVMLVSSTPIRDRKGNVFLAVVTFDDITEHKEIEERLERLLKEGSQRLWQSRANFQLLIQTMADGVIVVDREGRIRFTNPAAAVIFGWHESELINYPFGHPVAVGVTEIEVPRGEFAGIVELNVVEVNWGGEQMHLATLRDITERKRAEGMVQKLSLRLIESQEKERRKIGHELHDEVGGMLTALKLALHNAQRQLGEEAQPVLAEVNTLLDETVDVVSTLSHSMRPGILDDFGVLETLKWYFDRYTSQTGIQVKFTQDGLEKRLPGMVETAAYRIVQEALTNVARYAGTGEVIVSIRCTTGKLHIKVEDHGRGFDPSQLSLESSGISGMQDRAFLAGGTLTINSSPGNGTAVDCKLPL